MAESKTVKGANKANANNGKAPVVKIEAHANGAAFSDARPGVLASMLELLSKATREKPITKTQVLDALCAEYAERDRAKLKATVTGQLGGQWRSEKGIIVERAYTAGGERGYYVDFAVTRAYLALPTTESKHKTRQHAPGFAARLEAAKPGKADIERANAIAGGAAAHKANSVDMGAAE
jgi:hypothetical protein